MVCVPKIYANHLFAVHVMRIINKREKLLLNAFKSLLSAEGWFIHRTIIADANLIEIHAEISELLDNQV